MINKIKDFIQNLYCMLAAVLVLFPYWFIIEKCKAWRFRIRVAKAIENIEDLTAVASELQVANSTVMRWANGVAKPHPRMHEIILEVLERKYKEMK